MEPSPNKLLWHSVASLTLLLFLTAFATARKPMVNTDCESERFSHHCFGQGTYRCGTCECYDGYFGRRCECSVALAGTNDEEDCRPDNTTNIECSNRGQCVCGHCQCNQRTNAEEVVSGTYCECDNFSCDRVNGELCSGDEHGTCDCGNCICSKEWIGPACECSTKIESCIYPATGTICSNHGTCQCGKCVCENTATSRYSGRFCQNCPTCPDRCEEFLDCAQCIISGAECTSNCTETYEATDNLISDSDKHMSSTHDDTKTLCSGTDANQCRFFFLYEYNGNEELHIVAERKKDCHLDRTVQTIQEDEVGKPNKPPAVTSTDTNGLQLSLLKMQNYKTKLEIFKLEKELSIPHGEITKDL